MNMSMPMSLSTTPIGTSTMNITRMDMVQMTLAESRTSIPINMSGCNIAIRTTRTSCISTHIEYGGGGLA